MVKIFIDPGHGGTDSGAVGNGLQEKNLTLAISLKIRDMLLEYENVQIKMSRESDKTVSLQQRTNMANTWHADYLIAVHINSGGGEGYEDYIYTSPSKASVANQNILHAEVLKTTNMLDRGKKRRNFHMVRESVMPAILTENGFIDTVSDASKLKDPTFIERIARGHVNGLVQIYGLKEKKKPQPERKLTGVKPNWADWQWKEAEKTYREAREKGIIESDQWEKKAAKKDLTFDELTFLNLVLIGRTQ